MPIIEQELDLNFPRTYIPKLLEDYLEAFNNGGLSSSRFIQYWHYYSIQIIRFYGNLIVNFEAAQAEGLGTNNTIDLLGERVTLNKQTNLPALEGKNAILYEIVRKTATTEERFSLTQIGVNPTDIDDIIYPPTLTVKVKPDGQNPEVSYTLTFRSIPGKTLDVQGPLKINSFEKMIGGQVVRISTPSLISHPPDFTSIPQLP